MSRTRHHQNQRRNKCGLEWGAKRPGDKHYHGTPCKYQKRYTAKRERLAGRREAVSDDDC